MVASRLGGRPSRRLALIAEAERSLPKPRPGRKGAPLLLPVTTAATRRCRSALLRRRALHQLGDGGIDGPQAHGLPALRTPGARRHVPGHDVEMGPARGWAGEVLQEQPGAGPPAKSGTASG